MTRLSLIPLAALLFLFPALPAAAGHKARHDHRHHVRCHTDLCEDARTLERQTLRLLRNARHEIDYPDRAEHRALKRLAKLHKEARDFREATQDHRRLRPMIADYRELVRSFDRAEARFKALDPDRRMRKQLRRVTASVHEIEDRFRPVIARIERRHERRHARWERKHRDWRWDVAWNRY